MLHAKAEEWFPKGMILYLENWRPILRARAVSRRAVWPQAAFISHQSTGTLGSRPSLKLKTWVS